jgi:flagellar biosynthesis anti-sigma factor FlgM
MKIDNNRSGLDSLGTVKTEGTDAASSSQAARAEKARRGDQVAVSSGAQLAGAAVRAAEDAPDIRPEAVERAKALLEAGRIGDDPLKLADALIDRALNGD